ncbi:MAG TPA: hypothetical protein VM118_09510 [Acidobacteriota bacterium]|nr:hypothetical protein [Acidobacteriota bacterium]
MSYLGVTAWWRGIAIGMLSLVCATVALAAAPAERTHPLPRITHESLQPDAVAHSQSVVDDRMRDATWNVSSATDAVTSPGLQIGITTWDRQHRYSNGHQLAKNPGADVVHFTWTWGDQIDDHHQSAGRYVAYNSYSISGGAFNQGDGAVISIADFTDGGFPRIDVDGGNLGHVAFHQKTDASSPQFAWHSYFPVEGSHLHLDNVLPIGSTPPDQEGNLWTDVAVTQRPEGDIYHVIAMGLANWSDVLFPDSRIWYWRYDASAPSPTWEGPVVIDSSDLGPSYVIDGDNDANRVALAFHSGWSTDGLNELNNVAYYESHTGGAGWIDGSELGPGYRNLITAYDDPSGPQAWTNISVAYDNAGRLHIVFDEQRYAEISEQIAIRHWNSERGSVRTTALGYYANPNTHERALNFDQVTLGVGDGSTPCLGGAEANEDYLYVLYAKLGGETPEEQADISDRFYANGELYLTVSRDQGYNWSTPINLTNTKTPGCGLYSSGIPCASEMYATIARVVDDIHIFYVLDLSAGETYFESYQTLNSAMYLRYPGGTVDAPYVCPGCICPCIGDPMCDGIVNVLDVVNVVNEAFRGSAPVIDLGCSHVSRCDVNCDCKVDVLDVVIMVNHAFRWDIMPVCDACEEPCP